MPLPSRRAIAWSGGTCETDQILEISGWSLGGDDLVSKITIREAKSTLVPLVWSDSDLCRVSGSDMIRSLARSE